MCEWECESDWGCSCSGWRADGLGEDWGDGLDFLVIGDMRGDGGGESARRVKKGKDWMSGED